MERGKEICKTLKEIRRQVAEANEIPYEPTECKHEGDCLGTCPKCEQEVRYIESELSLRRRLGKAVTIIGVSAGLAALSACRSHKAVEFVEPSATDGDIESIEHPLPAGLPPAPPEPEMINDSLLQTEEKRAESMVVKSDTVSEDFLVGDVVEPMPQFPGGNSELKRFIEENTRYPSEALKDSIQGRVVVTFVIESDGSISETKVLRRVHPLLDAEALRVVSTMPKWIPAERSGKAIRVKYSLPVNFDLGKKKK